MKMEDHHNHNQHPNRQDYGGLADLRQLMNGRGTHFPDIPQATELFPGHRSLTPTPQGHRYEMLMVGRQVSELMACGPQQFTNIITNINNNYTNNTASSAAVSTPSLSGFEGEAGGSFGGEGGSGRWPRQETLTLLEIRSRLDSKFKEANQKGPLWDEVSRIMSEEHGYQRSGKKCREKFENLYKYYRKTKEGKAGRQDGKNYRFFRQLEALYGDSSNSVSVPDTHLVGSSPRFHTATNTCNRANQELFHSHQKLCDSLSLSNSSEFSSSSSDDNDLRTMENDATEKRRKKRGGRSWKIKIKEFIDSQMRKLMERQESWLEKLTTTLEQKEQERMLRDEDWRRQEEARIDREHELWAKERAWIEARDSVLIEALQNLTGKQLNKASYRDEVMASQIQRQSDNQNENVSQEVSDNWEESEVTRLIQLRTGMEERFQQSGCSQELVWEEIAANMVCLGHDKNSLMCKEKWDNINSYMKKTNKKRKESSRGCSNYFMYNQGGGYCEMKEEEKETAIRLHQTNEISSPSYPNVANAVSDSCFRLLLADGDHLWENYGLKVSRGENQ